VANILSQDEVDALLSSFSEEEGAPDPTEATAASVSEVKSEAKISVYDFRRPNRISKDQLRFLETLHETFVVRFSGVLSGYMRTMVELEILSIEQLTYGEWVQSLPEATCVFPFGMEPLQGSGAVELNPTLALSIVDRLLGGQGSAVDQTRDLTHLETSILARVVEQKLAQLADTWSELVKFTPRIEGYEKQPNLLKLLPDPETVVLVTLEVKTQTLNGTIAVCYPFVALEPALTRASAGAFGGHVIRPRKVPEAPLWLGKGIEAGVVQLTTRLGTGTLTVKEFIGLAPGDVVRLSTRVDTPIEIDVGGQPKFRGRPGLVGRKLAVEVIDRLHGEREEEGPAQDEAQVSELQETEAGGADVEERRAS
jgi:flagellar motor switch protein FliM